MYTQDSRESLKRYFDAKTKVDVYNRRLCEEAENLFSHFVEYAKRERERETNSFSQVVEDFYLEVLNMECNSNDRSIRSSLTRRFKGLLKRHIREDSRYQHKLDEFML